MVKAEMEAVSKSLHDKSLALKQVLEQITERLEQKKLEKKSLEQERLEQQRLELQKLDQKEVKQQKVDHTKVEPEKVEQKPEPPPARKPASTPGHLQFLPSPCGESISILLSACPIRTQSALYARLRFLLDESLNLLFYVERHLRRKELSSVSSSLGQLHFALVGLLPVSKTDKLHLLACRLHAHANALAELWHETAVVDLARKMYYQWLVHPHRCMALSARDCRPIYEGIKEDAVKCVKEMRYLRSQRVSVIERTAPAAWIPVSWKGIFGEVMLVWLPAMPMDGFIWTAPGPKWAWKGPSSDLLDAVDMKGS
jgi:hypothetical protein